MVAANTGVKDQKYETPFTIEDRERGSQPRGVHHNGVIISMGLKGSLRSIRVVHRPTYKGPFTMDYRERGSQARRMYHTQDTSRMKTVRVKQEEEDDRRIITR